MRYKTYHKVLVFVIPAVSLAVLGAAAVFILSNFELWQCPFLSIFHVYCAGCGATRAATALLHGDILLSLRQNAVIIAAIILALMWYIELVLRIFGKNVKLPLIHSVWFYVILGVVLIAYLVLRNFIPEIAPVGTRAGLGINYN